MGSDSSITQFLREYIFFNPIVWGIVAVILWIVGPAFYRALRGKDKEHDG
jgi:hypothetical protein